MPSASKDPETMLWGRVDRPGHEAARLLALGSAWHLAGTAVFSQDGDACSLEYLIQCDAAWQATSARVAGRIGARAIELRVVADAVRRWQLNGIECPNVAGCVDIDLAFSPSTNLLPIRRLNLRPGEAAEIRAAWLRFPELILEPLNQVYRRIDVTTYHYESGGGAFTALLRTNAAGFVTSYPGLWEAVDSRSA
jgi:hypothetical protein